MTRMVDELLRVAGIYCENVGIAQATLSTRIFNDGRRLGRLQRGRDLATGSHEKAMLWLSDNWPEGLTWPPGIERPAGFPPGDEAA